MIFALAGSAGYTGLRRDGHQGLSDGLLPALSHLHADSRGGQSRAVVVTAVVLPYIVDHGGCDDLKAVRVAALSQIAVVSALLYLEDLRQRDFLWKQWRRTDKKSRRNIKEHNLHFSMKAQARIRVFFSVFLNVSASKQFMQVQEHMNFWRNQNKQIHSPSTQCCTYKVLGWSGGEIKISYSRCWL